MKRIELGHGIAAIFLPVAFATMVVACATELPEPESPEAQLYTQYCSGDGCHDPIPPKALSQRIWDMQYTRMLDVMKRAGRSLPTAGEERQILEYLHRHADGATS